MSIFGNSASNKPASATGSSLFGTPASTTPAAGNLFGNTAATSAPSLFGNTATSGASTSGLFGGTQAPKASPFGATNTAQQPAAGSLFGGGLNTTSQPAQSTGLFGTSNQSQPAQGGGQFGVNAAQPATGSLFGGAASASGTTGGLFGSSTGQSTQTGGLFGVGSKTANPGGSLFGNQNTQNAGSSLFGTSTAQNNQNNQSTLQPAAPDLSQSMMDSRRVWNEEDAAPRSRTVMEQLQLVDKKWDPNSAQHAFQTYLYNQVQPDAQPFYRPGPGESEDVWEDALKKAPNPGAIPFRVKGFYELGLRIVSQRQHLEILSGRLHEINNGLTSLLRRHELEIASRTAAARRRHAALSQKILTLTTKTIMARNRGYALDGAEEELRKKLVALERGVLDPALSGREEEIWARMVSVREKGQLLEAELQRAGLNGAEDGQKQEISEEVLKQAKKVLQDYDSQLSHLTKELEQIKTDWSEWESSKGTNRGASESR